MSSEQNRLTFLTGLGVVLDGKIPAGLPPYPKLDLTMLPIGGSRIEAKAMFTVPVDTNNVSNFAAIIDRLRTAKILPPGNLTDPAKGVFQSDTGELVMRTAENRPDGEHTPVEGGGVERGKRLSFPASPSKVRCPVPPR